MADFLETSVDKFIFRVATDRLYNEEGVWAKPEGSQVRVGISDFLQQRSGDVAFAEVKMPGEIVQYGEEFASIETIKVDISLSSPLSGQVVEVNPAMDDAPEIINEDPFGEGWMALIEAADWEADRLNLLDPDAYFAKMKKEAENEVRNQ